MSTIPATPTPAPMPPERRAYPRKRLDQLAYIGFGADTGGVLLDLSEEGLRCQIVGAVVAGDRCHLKFVLPGQRSPIEADGEVVWANRSRQGGGVRLVSLGPNAQQDIQQWLRDVIESPSPAKPSSVVPARTRSVGAVHVPEPRRPAGTVPVANIPPVQAPVASPQESARLIEHGPLPASNPVPASEGAKAGMEMRAGAPTYIAAEEQTPPPDAASFDVQAEAGPIAETAEPIAAAMECATPPAVPASIAPAASVVRKPAPQTAEPRAMQTSSPERRTALAYSQPAPQKGRFTRVLVLAGCIIGGIATLAVSGYDPAILHFDSITAEIAPPTIATPTPPEEMTELKPTAPPAEPTQSIPPSGRESSDVAVRTPAAQIVRPQPPAARTTAPNRPAQDLKPTRPANAPRLALAVPRRRTTSSAPPTIAVPQMPLEHLDAEAPLTDMPALESRDPELPQPVADYRPPQLISQIEPAYSLFARQAHLQGMVRVNAKVGIDGVPRSLVCVSGNAVLCRMAFEAIGKWRYEPAISDGRPVEAQVLVSFNFQLR